MAASEETCDGNPNFAIICSFITKFGDDCGVSFSIPYLQQMLEDTKNVNEDLQELLIHLLRRGRKRVNKERWEKCLIKFCHEYSSVDAWEIERFGFTKAKLSLKLEILKRLLELQFDANAKFKAEVNKLDAGSLRLLPLGRDIDGQAYWYQFDKEYNIRLYRETIGEEGAWQLLCSNTEDIRKLLTTLERKHSGSASDMCEDKSTDSNPKSPSSDMLPVPKKELDTEDLTSHLSESKPCTIIIKTEKRDTVFHSEVPNSVKSENCGIDTDKKAIGCEIDNSTKGSVKLKLKLEPSVHSRTEHKSSDRNVTECSAVIEKAAVVVLDAEPMEVETSKPASSDVDLQPKSVPVDDVEMVEENASADNIRPVSKSEEQSDQKFSTKSNNPTVVKDHSNSVNHHKSSKIRLYEKWSSEKKKLDTSKPSVEECNIDSKPSSVVEEKDQGYSVTSNQKNDPAIPLKHPSEQSSNSELINKQTDLSEQNKCADNETAVDLSKSSRVNVIVQNMCSKPVLSNGVSSATKSNTEKSEKDSVGNFDTSNLETTKRPDSSRVSCEKSHDSSLELNFKPLETESSKVHKRTQSYSDCYDTSVITKTGSVSGFSHLQALQNMCESNVMGGIPSVIQSTNRCSVESNRIVISETKNSVSCDIRYESMNRKYTFSDVHCSKDKTLSGSSETINMVLKSNVQKSEDERHKKMEIVSSECQGKSQSSSIHTIINEQESSQETPTDLSFSDHTKPDNCDLKSSENLNKTSASTVNKSDTLLLKENVEIDVKEKEKIKLPEKTCDVSRKNMCATKQHDSGTKKDANLCSSSEENMFLDSLDPSLKRRESPDEQTHATDLSCGKAETNPSESAIKSNKTGSCMSDISSELPYSENLQRDEHKKFLKERKDISVIESVKEPDKSSEPNNTIIEHVSKPFVSSSSLDNCKEEILVPAKIPTNSSKSVLKESEVEPVTELKEPVEVKDTPLLLKETDSTVKACFKTPETAEKGRKIVPNSKCSASVAESKAPVDSQTVDKEQKVVTNEYLSKPNEIPYLDEKCSRNELNTNLQSKAGEANENMMHSTATMDCKNSKTVNSEKEELDSALDDVIRNDVPGKSCCDYFPTVECKIEASKLCTSGGKRSMKENDIEKLAEKTMDVEKVSEKEIFVKKISEKEAGVKKAPENEMNVKKVPEVKVGVEKALVSEMNIEKLSENEMDALKISENKLNIGRLLEEGKDDRNISEKEIDAGKAFEKEKDKEKTCESGKDVIKTSENKVGNANIDAKKVSEDKEDIIKVAENKKDVEKVSENELHAKKASDKEAHLEKIFKNEIDVDKVSDRNVEMEKVFESEMDVEKVFESETAEEKVYENEVDAEKACENEMDVEKVTEIGMDGEKVTEHEMYVEKVVEAEKDVTEVAESEKLVLQAAENKKEDIKVSKSRREGEKVSENEKDVEKLYEYKKDAVKVSQDSERVSKSIEKASEIEKDSEKVAKSIKDAVEVSKNEKDSEKVSESNKDVVKTSKNEKDLEKVSESNKDVVKTSKNEKDLEKVSKSIKDAIKVSENKKDSEKVPKSNNDAVKVSENEKDSDTVSKIYKDVVKASENVRATEKVSENEKNSVNASKSKKDIVKISKNEKDGLKSPGNEKATKKVSENEKDSEKVSKSEKDIVNRSINEKDALKASKKEKAGEKVFEDQKDSKKISKSEKDVVKICRNEMDAMRASENGKAAEKVSENEKDSEKISGHEKNAEKKESVEKLSKIEKSVENLSEKEKKVFENKGDAEKISLKEVNVENKNKKEENSEKVTVKDKEAKKVTKREKHVEKITKVGEKMSKNEMNVEKVSKELDVEEVSKEKKDMEKKSNSQRDFAVVHKNKMDNEKACGRENDINKVAENEKGEEKLSKKHKELKNQNDVKGVLESKKCEAEVSEIEENAKKVSINERDTEQLSGKKSSDTVEESKSKLPVGDCETIEEIDKLDNKNCLHKKNDIDNKSEGYKKSSTSLHYDSKEKSLQRELNEKNEKLSTTKDDSDLKLSSDSLVEIDNEKSMENKTDFSYKGDEMCSKIDVKEKLDHKHGGKSEAVSEKNFSDDQDIAEKDNKSLSDKTGGYNDSSTNEKDVEMPDICSSKATDELSVVMKPEGTCKKSDIEDGGLNDKKVENISKTRKSKGRSSRKALFTRRKNRNKKDPSLEVSNIKINCDTVSSSKGGKRKTEELSVVLNIGESTVSSSKEADECNKSVLKFEVPYEEQLKVYNLRHGICLETKFKHPFCDKYVKKNKELKNSHVLSECTIELTNDENLLANFNEVSPASTKTRSRGKNSKQQINKKPESVLTPVTKSVPSIKKTPASSAKKRQNRGRKKEDLEKDDFAIPEGFLEILGNAEKASDKGVSGKKRKGYELKDSSASQQNSENESAPIKRSRRIQEQHQKKMTELAVEMEREQRILEQLAKRSNNAKRNAKNICQKPTPKSTAKGLNAKINAKGSGTPTKSPKARAKLQALAAEEETCMESRRATRKMNSRSKNLTKMTLMYEDESKDSQFSTSRETEKSKRRRRGRGQRKGFRPWDVSSESESSIEELTEEEEEEPDEPLIFDVNEDEFACEEVDPNAEPVVIRRARTAKKTEIEDTAEECINDDTPCKKCGKYDKPEWILLCDKCDSGYHTHCLIPPLMIVPDGDWFCQPCEHMSLCQCLHEELSKLEVVLKQREREELRKQRLAYVGISLDNVLKPEKKEKSDESEKEEEEEEEEKEEYHKPPRVVQSVDDERHQKLYGKRSVRARRNVNYQFKEYDALIASALQEEMLEVPEDDFKEEEDGSDAGSDKPFTAKISKRKKRGRRWKDLDFSDEDEDSEDEYQGGSTDSEATMPPSSNSDQESGSGEWKISKSKKKSQRKPPKSRRRRRGGDSSEEDWDDEIADNEAYRPTTRRAAQKAISYRELSSDEEDEWGAKPQAIMKRRKVSSSGSEDSFKRKPSKKKRIRKWASSNSSESEEEKSMSSSEGESEEEGSQEDESENEWKIDRKEKIMRLKSNTNKKVLSSEDDEESSTQDSAPKKQPKQIISDESEEEDEEEEESESEENSEESEEEEDEEEDKEKKVPKKPSDSEKKVPPAHTVKITPVTSSKPDTETKEIPTEKTESTVEEKSSMDKPGSVSITESREFQPKVLVKKELCSVDIPLEPIKQTVTITPVVDKAPPKTVRKETTKMVPCVIPYDKSPKSGHTSNPEEESDKETSKEEVPRRVPPQRPAHFPKRGTSFTSPSSRIQFGGVLARHTVPPLSSSVRSPVPPTNAPPRMLAPTNLSTRPSTIPSVVVRHTAPTSNLPARPNIPSSKMPVPPSTPSTTAPPTQTVQSNSENKGYKSTIMEPFSNMDDENDSDDEVPLERIPNACVPAPLPNRPVSYEREAEYRPAAKELSSYSYAPPEEKPFPGSYSSLAPFQDYSARPSPLKPSLVETYPNNSSPSKLTPLDTYSQTSSPKGFISLDSYSENRKKKHFFGNSSSEADAPHRPPPSSSENFQGGEIRFPPEPYPCPQSPTTYPNRSPSPTPRDPGTPPRLYSQFPDAYAPPRSPEYYQNHQYYASEERIPRPSYQPNYAPQEPSFVSNPYVATPVPQPNGGFMIDTLLRARNHENEEDELTGVTDIVSYITEE